MKLDGRVALVTGATSGIGAATARAFAAAGARVMISGREAEAADRTATAIAEAGGTVSIRLGDVGDSAFCDELVAATVAHYGRLDVLANVAGVITRGDATNTSEDEWRLNHAVNLDAVFFLSRAAVRHMRQQQPSTGGTASSGGVIVNLASNVGLVGAGGLVAYCASKGAVIQLTKAMALDHARDRIRINALCPGAVATPMLFSGHDKTGQTPDQVRASNIESIPEGRIPEPDEIAKSMLYLASDASSHVTGVALPIDGGYLAR